MKMTKRVPKSITATVAVVLIFVMCAMQVMAASYGYKINNSTPVSVCSIRNTNQSEASVAYLNTRPATPNAQVTIHVKATNSQYATDLYAKSFPYAVSVSDLSFSIPAGKTYYVYVTADSQFPVEGSVSVTHIIP